MIVNQYGKNSVSLSKDLNSAQSALDLLSTYPDEKSCPFWKYKIDQSEERSVIWKKSLRMKGLILLRSRYKNLANE